MTPLDEVIDKPGRSPAAEEGDGGLPPQADRGWPGRAAGGAAVAGIDDEEQLGWPFWDGSYMTRTGPLPTRLICSPTVKSGTSNGDGSLANHSVEAPNVSAMNSCVPLPEIPPGVWSSTPWPISWAITSIAPIHWLALLWPTWTWVPS